MATPQYGFQRDGSNLNINVAGDPSVTLTAAGMTIPSGETLTVSGTLSGSGTINLASGTVTLPTRTAVFDVQELVKGADGAALSLSETAGDFYRSIGTNQWLILGEVTNNETEVSVGTFSWCLPQNYVAGGTITITAGVDITGTGALGSCTIDFSAYLQNATTGAIGSDLVTTAATAISATEGLKAFTITPTGLVAGDRLVIVMTTSVVVSDMNNAQAQISALYFSVQVNT